MISHSNSHFYDKKPVYFYFLEAKTIQLVMEDPVHTTKRRLRVVQPKKGMALIGMGHGFVLLNYYKENYIFGLK